MDTSDTPGILARARTGDERAFAELVAPHERALFRHCYRMLGSGADAEEAVQDALERAWRRLDSYVESGPFGGWLYRIASNGCLDRLRTRRRRANPPHHGPPLVGGTPSITPDVSIEWIEPVADDALGLSDDPASEVVRREHISLAFVAALQMLQPRQRAVLLLCDVLGFTHDDVASTLDVTSGSVNSLLYRARQRMQSLDAKKSEVVAPDDPAFRDLLGRYVRAWESADVDELVTLLVDDVGFSMPPLSDWFQGIDVVAGFVESAIFAAVRPATIPLRPVSVNGQPAFVVFDPGDDERLRPTGLQVLDIVKAGDALKIQHITSYRGGDIVEAARLIA